MAFFLKNLFLFLIIIPCNLFSQETDTLKPNRFENFFGSDCPMDTVKIVISKNDYCFFYTKQFKLSRIKNEEIKWSIDLDEFQKSDYICIIQLNRKLNRKGKYRTKKRIVCILGYRNAIEIKRRLIKLPSGKFV